MDVDRREQPGANPHSGDQGDQPGRLKALYSRWRRIRRAIRLLSHRNDAATMLVGAVLALTVTSSLFGPPRWLSWMFSFL
jgi:hypothetical protein